MSGYLPQSESELQRAQPSSNERGALPSEALLGSEKVIYETHPRILRLHPILFWTPLPFVVLLGLVLVLGVLTEPNGLVISVVGVFVFLLPVASPTIYAIYSARRTTYALTDQRTLTRSGENFVSVTYDQIVAVTAPPKSSKVVFSLRPQDGKTSAPKGRSAPPTMVWKAVPGAPAVAAYASSATRFYQMRLRQKQLRQDLVTASTEDRIVCQYCGGWILLSSLQPENPRCPRCSAPIVVAPLGM